MDPYGQQPYMHASGSLSPYPNLWTPPPPSPFDFQNFGPAPPGSPQTLSTGLGSTSPASLGYPPQAPPIGDFGSPYGYGISPSPTYPPPVYGTSSAPSSTFAQATSIPGPLHAPASQPAYALGGPSSNPYCGVQQQGGYAPPAGSVLTPNQLDAFTKAFQVYDRDRDGFISMEELGTALRALGHPCSIPELKDLIRSADHDGDMKINMQEFASLMATRVAQDEANLLKTFRAFDKDKNGRISKSELKEAMSQLGQQLTSAQVKKMMDLADVDGDGELNYTEFARMLSMQQ